ncbi:MAG: hypothetical protein NTW86_05340 [Candidatus Sumerlaeota bacterium]|nr:hypothetical protein [Candidatus Sumerlaeota bacterium]
MNFWPFAAALCLCGFAAPAAEPAPTVAPGWDWLLPEGIQPAPYSGFVTWGKGRFSDMITVAGVMATWKQMCPAPDTYDWTPVLQAIEKNKAAGMRSGIHLKGVESGAVPDWIVRQYNVPVIPVQPLSATQPWHISIVPPWHPDVMREYRKFLDAFAKTGIARREDVVYGYIHGISPSRGEELFLRKQDVADWEAKAGLTPQGFADCIKARTDAMLAGFQGVEWKLAWMTDGGPVVNVNEAYKKATADLCDYAISHGTGWRGGGVDFMHNLFESSVLGASIDKDGYCVIDETLPLLAERRFRGDENEEYGKGWEWRFGPYEGHEYRHRISTLRTLQLRQNFQMVSGETLTLNPDLNRYAMLTQGRLWDDSPDAWAYLRECVIKPNTTVKNLERWLIQRDVDGSRSVACERVDRYKLGRDPDDHHFDMDARRTDRKNGQDGLAFQLDSKFWTQPQAAILKVTFTDRDPARWHVAYTDARSGGAKGEAKTASVENTGDGQRKTATFEIANLAAARQFPGQMDFRLVSEGPGDLTVTMVRVIKKNWKEPEHKPR